MPKFVRKLGIPVVLALLATAGGWLLFERDTNDISQAAADFATRMQALVSDDSTTPPAATTSEPDSKTLPEGASAEWLAKVQKDISLKQFAVREISADELPTGIDATHWAPNPTHNLKTYFTANGIAVRPFNTDNATATEQLSAIVSPSDPAAADAQVAEAAAPQSATAAAAAATQPTPSVADKQPWSFGMSLAGVGTPGAVADADVAAQNIDGNRVEYQRGNVTEWYVNDGNGLEQGFTVNAPPADVSDELVLTLKIDGNLSARVISSEMVALDDGDGQAELYLRNLLVKDANDAVLPAQFASVNGKLAISVDVSDASYPILVDPVLSNVAAFLEVNQANAHFGTSVAAAGDVNGDGYNDVIVGAPELGGGSALVYLGSASGLPSSAAWQISNAGKFGTSVAAAGDVNGDGYGDVVVGAPYLSQGTFVDQEGVAFVYLGASGGLASTPVASLQINSAYALFGGFVAAAGDVNSDGYGDLVIGAANYSNGQSSEGAAFVYLGSSSGPAVTAAWQIESNQANAGLGNSVASAGDVNGDGYSDVIVGAAGYDSGQTDEGRAYVYLGSSGGLAVSPVWQIEPNQTGANFGFSVASAGDVNGDGYSDVIVGAARYDNGQTDEGAVFVYLGSGAGLAAVPANQIEINQAGVRFGWSVAAAGDINSDGYGDVIVGGRFYTNWQASEGAAFVYLGSSVGLNATPAWQVESNLGAAYFGSSVAGVGDVNGDGYSEVLVGAPYYDYGGASESDEGAVFMYLGAAAGLSSSSAWQVSVGTSGGMFGKTVASAGDVNGDGYGDVIIGAPLYSAGSIPGGAAFVYLGSVTGLAVSPAWTALGQNYFDQFGGTVARAGDVNGDGYDDVIVGARNASGALGSAFVYLGSAGGLALSPAWQVSGSQSFLYFGSAVAGAGDVNGDGYSDVIVGAQYDDIEVPPVWHAYVYLGSAVGLATSPVWQKQGTVPATSDGPVVAGAGDVNGDGFADVAVGIPTYGNGQDNEGVTYVYLGSANGLAASVAWTMEGNEGNAKLGTSVRSAGDVNGDGYGDLIVGSPGSFNQIIDTQQNVALDSYGAANLYLGSAGGLMTSPVARLLQPPGTAVGPFGAAVASAGDVNGDSYGDLIVGDSSYGTSGAAYLYLGSASSFSGNPAPTLRIDGTSGVNIGRAVASAGDVNGDGYGDLIFGDSEFTSQNGVATVYQGGNGATGFANVPRQTKGVISIASLGAASGSFISRLKGYAANGISQAKLRVEACALPAAFGSTGCSITEGNSFLPVTTSGSVVTKVVYPVAMPLYGQTANTFSVDGLHRWRAQVKYNVNAAKAPPWAPRRTPWRYYQGDLAKSVVDIVVDADGDSIRDRLDPDDDNDAVADVSDAFPQNNAEGYDNDNDGTGDNGDTDDDGDGTPDNTDTTVGTPSLLLSNLGSSVTATAGTAFNLDINSGFDGAGRTTTWYSGTPYYVLQKSDGAGGWITLTVNGSGFIQDSELGWLTFDPATGELSGFPQSGNTGVYNLRLVVTNGSGGSAYDIDTTGDGSALAPAFNFTFTVPENFAPSVTISALGSGGYVTSEPIITGTASDPEAALDRIDIQIEGDNGTAYIGGDIVNGAPVWNTICSGNGCSSWQLDTTAENYVDSVYYTVRARARDTAGNTTTTETDFTFYGGVQTYTTLQLIPNSTSILFEDTMQLNVKLSVPGNAGANLNGLPVVISINRPQGSVLADPDEIIRSVAADGTFTQPLLLGAPGSPVQFDETGDWTLSARFNVDPPTLPQYQAVTSNNVTLSVGASAGYAVLVQGKISTGEGQLEHNKTLNRIYRTMTRRNLRDQDIYYYNHNASQDANEDGYPDNNNFFNPYQGVDEVPDKATVQSTIENIGLLARNNPGPVWIVLHDHGNRVSNASVFQLTPTSTITPAELDSWITTLENNLYTGTGITPATAPVIIVNAYCYSGGFIETLSKPGRIVIGSASEVEASYKGPLEDDGLRSGEVFAEALFEELGYDQDIYTAFSEATDKTEAYTRSEDALNPNTAYPYFDTSVQHPLLDDNGDGVGSNELSPSLEGDGQDALSIKLGTGLTVLTNSVESPAALLRVTPTLVLNPATDHAELWAEPNFPSYVAARFYEVRPPAVVLPSGIQGSEQLEAASYTRHIMGGIGNCAAPNNLVYCTDHGTAATTPDNFSVPGKYQVFYYVKDVETGDLSPQLTSTVYKQLAGNLAPPAPALTYPANAASNVFRAALLEWTGVIDADLTGSPLTYTVRIATDAAMTNLVYTAEEVPYAFHQVPLSAGLNFSTTYYWDVEAIDGYGASLDRNGSGVWSPSAPFSFTTEGSGNNVYGVVHGAIRGLTVSNQVITSLTNASIAQTNNTALSERVSYDPTIQNSNGTTGAYAYTVWALPGTVTLQADADSFVAKNKTGITVVADQTLTGQNFLLSAEVVPVTVRVNNDVPLHAHHNHAPNGGLPDDVVPVNIYGSATISANLINPASLKVGPGQAPDRNNAAVLGNVNADGYQDATFDVWMSTSQIACNATQVTVTGETTGGQAFSGTDTVSTDCNAVCH